MERVNVVVVASLAAALVLVVLRLFSPTDVLSSPNRSAEPYRSQVDGDQQLPPGAKGWTSRGARTDEPGSENPPSDEESGGSDRSNRRRVARGGTAELVPGSSGARRNGDARASRGPTYTGVLPSSVSDGMVGSRVGAVPPPRGLSDQHSIPPSDGSNGRHVLEFVDEPNEPPPEDAGPEVLFKLPLNGDVKPEVGSGAIEADGLISQGGEIQFPDDAELSVPVGDNVRGEAGSVSFDFRPQWAGSDPTNNSLLAIRDENVWENSLAIVKNGDALRFIIRDSAGGESNVNIPITDWSAGDMRHITATWDGSSMTLYINGQVVGAAPLDNPLVFKPTTLMHIGSDYPTSPYGGAGGTMGPFTVFDRALTAEEVSKG